MITTIRIDYQLPYYVYEIFLKQPCTIIVCSQIRSQNLHFGYKICTHKCYTKLWIQKKI